MLVLTRQRDQAIMIGNDIEITVVLIRGDKVRIGIAAPQSVAVHRKEVYEAIRRENQASANLSVDVIRSDLIVLPTPQMKLAAESIDDPFMRQAIDEAKQGMAEGGLPIGSVLARDGHVIAAGHNRRVQNNDPMAHAEIDCLTRAGRQDTYRDTVLYSTLMPCFLCSGAIVQFGIPKVVVGESKNFPGGAEFLRQHGVEVVDLQDAQCIKMMTDFIHDHPRLWDEDIGR